jgi:SAM-dependent methyltransferase
MDYLTGQLPRCPITGLPATRRIQQISARLLGELWRRSFGVRAERQLAAIGQFDLWESPCGLAFFEPMLAGDETFYRDLYSRGEFYRALSTPRIPRAEFKRIAELVREGDRVLDVACGEGGLAHHLPHAAYVGLDPHCNAAAAGPDIRNETVAEHAALHPEEYDAVCALHAIEHVSDPLGFARDLVRCLKPGGALCIVVPSRASALTKLPNFVLNAPPHHLSWWNAAALNALSNELGLGIEAVEAVPFSFDSMIYWMGRFSPRLTGNRYFRAHWTWHGALALSWLAGRACDALVRVPASAEPSGLLLIARKPS